MNADQEELPRLPTLPKIAEIESRNCHHGRTKKTSGDRGDREGIRTLPRMNTDGRGSGNKPEPFETQPPGLFSVPPCLRGERPPCYNDDSLHHRLRSTEHMHRWSQLFIPTLREAPADAEVASHKFLVRSGYIRQLGAGIYSYLFMGQRSILKIIDVIREEMNTIGQEFLLPAIHPREVWEQSGRWQLMGDNMFRLKDRKGADLCLGMTHEEIMTDIARKELRSYKQLPQIWYQIQTKFRDEPRPKAGLLRVRQFTMKDAYSFDIDADGLDVSYKKHYATYGKIFDRCGLRYVVVEAH